MTVDQKELRVTASLIRYQGRILIAQRQNFGRFANKWEFPGGKIDLGETPPQALRRELEEELGIRVEIGGLYSETLYRYEFGRIRQYTYWVDLSALPDGLQLHEHQAIAWVTPDELSQYEFAGADCAVLERLIQSGF
jgi:8-oxo-dGTP diphosphatase